MFYDTVFYDTMFYDTMFHDAALPPGLAPSSSTAIERQGLQYTSARWAPADLERLATRLGSDGRTALSSLDGSELLAAWIDTVESFRNPGSAERRALEPALLRGCGLSGRGLAAALEAVLGGVSAGPARELAAAVQPSDAQPGEATAPVLAILASNLPALAVQPLLPALLSRRPTILKSPTSEPFFAPAFVGALGARCPAIARATAALTWPGGHIELETPLLAGAGRVLAYGEAETLADLERRAPGKVFGYGPRVSLAVVGADADLESAAAGLARDVALFDQRGCLSVHAVYLETPVNAPAKGPPETLCTLLAQELEAQAAICPAGPLDPAVAAGVQQLRVEARMRGLFQPSLAVDVGTVILEPETRFRPSPGARTVRVHALKDLKALPGLLRPWRDSLQGVALAGDAAWGLRRELTDLGVSRFASPGELQTPDALWHNGGIHPLAVLAPAGPT